MSWAPFCCEVAARYATSAHTNLTPSGESATNNNCKNRKTNLHIQLPLSRPNQIGKTAKVLAQPIQRKPTTDQTIGTTAIASTTINDKSSGSCWKERIKHAIATTTDCTRSSTSDVLRLMDSISEPIPPDIYTSLVKECTFKRDSSEALQLHAHIIQARLRPTLPLLNRILLMHVSCGHISTARQLFDQMTPKDFCSWAIIIVTYLDMGDYTEALILFVKMMQNRNGQLEFPAWIMVGILKACVSTLDMGLGKQVHALLLKSGTANDLSQSGSLMNFYGKFGCLDDANLVFNKLSRLNTVSWTVKIVNECKEGHFYEVICAFNKMGRSGIKKNAFTFSSVIKACARMDDGGNCGQQVHANAIKLGLEMDAFVQCGLVDMYGKCGLLTDAERVFEAIRDKRNTACWNAMLMGYVQNGFYIESIKFLYRMKAAKVEVGQSFLNDVRIACGAEQSD